MVFNLLAVALILACLEAGFRIFGKGPSQPPAVYIADWRENFDGEFSMGINKFQPPENREGFRDIEHQTANPENRFRVIFLGDSVTYGFNLPFYMSYHQRLRKALDERGVPAEVFSMARPGWTVRQYRIALEKYAGKYGPDLVIAGCCLNDIAEIKNNLNRPPEWLVWLARHSALVYALVDPEDREVEQVEELFEIPPPPKIQNAYELFFQELLSLSKAAEKSGAQFCVTLFPFLFQVRESMDPIPQKLLEDFCKKNSIRYINILPVFEGTGDTCFIDHDHLSPIGAKKVARALERELFPAVF